MVSPQGEQEMIPFLRAYVGKGMQFRTPKRMWEDLWRLKRGEMNHVMGMRKFGKISNFKGPKFQRGIMHPIGFWAPSGTEPDLSDITDEYSVTSPASARISIAYDSDGTIVADLDAGLPGTITYAQLTTNSDDSNDHTNEWWPDAPSTNEGLNWDIRYTNLVEGGSATGRWYFYDTGGAANRIEDTWYLLDTVSNDHADASVDGALGINRNNGGVKTPTYGSADNVMDVEIGVKDSSTATASHQVDITVTGTV